MAQLDYYHTLGIAKEADAEEVRKAYRDEAKRCDDLVRILEHVSPEALAGGLGELDIAAVHDLLAGQLPEPDVAG